jgi:Organic solute transporter Ostalpha
MVPIYAIESWLGLRFRSSAVYFDTMRECYESMVIYSFYSFLVEYLGGERHLARLLRSKETFKHPFPFNYMDDWPMGGVFLHKTKVGILQFVVLKPIMALLSFGFDAIGMYWDGEWSWGYAYPYIMLIDNISQTIALYALIVFYQVLKDDLAPVKPVPKFLVVKSVVFFTFWQGVTLSILKHIGILDMLRQADYSRYSSEDFVTSIQDFLVCIEMFAAAVAHHYAFPYKEFHDPAMSSGPSQPVFRSIFQAVDVTDVFLDDVDTMLNNPREEPELSDDMESSPLLNAHHLREDSGPSTSSSVTTANSIPSLNLRNRSGGTTPGASKSTSHSKPQSAKKSNTSSSSSSASASSSLTTTTATTTTTSATSTTAAATTGATTIIATTSSSQSSPLSSRSATVTATAAQVTPSTDLPISISSANDIAWPEDDCDIVFDPLSFDDEFDMSSSVPACSPSAAALALEASNSIS